MVGLEDRVGGDAREEVVAGEQRAVCRVVQREVADGVAGSDGRLPGAITGADLVAVVEQSETFGVDRVGEVADRVVERSEGVAGVFWDAEVGDESAEAGAISTASALSASPICGIAA